MFRLIVWLCTYNCNLNCKHCYVKGRNEIEMSTNDAIKMIGEIAELNPRHFSITGGEPLIRNDILDLLKTTYEYDLNTSIVTNGYYLNEDIARKLYEYEIYVYLSLDAGSRDTCNLIRGFNSWNKILSAAEIMRRIGVEFSTIMTIMPENYLEVDSFILKSIEIGADHSSLIPIIPSGNARNRFLEPSKLLKAFKLAENIADNHGYYISFWCSPFLRWIKESKYVYVGSCPDDAIDIDPAGNLLICDTLKFKTSNVLEKGVYRAIKEHFNNPLTLKFKDNSKLKGKCSICKFRDKCGGGCRARSYLIYNDFYMPDPSCPINNEIKNEGI